MKHKETEQKKLDPYCLWDEIVHEAVVEKAKKLGTKEAIEIWRKKHEND